MRRRERIWFPVARTAVSVGVDGKRIRTASDVEAALNNKAVGDTLRVTYKRGTDGVRSIAPAAVPCAAAKSL